MHTKIFLQRIINFLCITSLAIVGFLTFSQGTTVFADTTTKLAIKTADYGNISVSGDGIENKTVGNKYICYDIIPGNSILIKAIPNEGYSFKEFSLVDADSTDVTSKLGIIKTNQTIEFKMPKWEVKISASFKKGVTDEENTTDSSEKRKDLTKSSSTTKEKSDTKETLEFDTDNLNDYSAGETVDPADVAILTSKGISLMRAQEQSVSSGAHLSVSIKADKTSGGTYNNDTMKYEGDRTPGIYKYPEVVTYNIIVKNYGDTDLHYVKVTDTISEELKNSVDVNSIKFDLQKGYYVTTDTGEQVFVSVDDTNSSSTESTESNTSSESDSTPSYSAGSLTKSLTIDTIRAGKSINLKLTMTARKDIKRALNLKNSVNVTASTIESTEEDNDSTEDVTTEAKEDTSEAEKDNTEETTEASSESEEESTTSTEKVKETTSAAGVKSKIVSLPVDEAMHNDTEIISIGKYAVHYPQMSVSMSADKTTVGNTNTDGVIDSTKSAGIYKAGDLVKFIITVKNEGNVTLHDVTLSDAVSDTLKSVLLSGTDGYYFDKTATITDSQGNETSVNITTSGQTTAVISQLESGATAKVSFLAKIKSDAKEAKQLVNKVSLTAKWANVENNTTQYESVESDLTKHVAEDAINVVGTPKMAVSILANKTTGVTLGENGKYQGTRISGKYASGDTVEYKVNVSNLGGTTLYNLKVTGNASTELQKALSSGITFASEGTITTASGNEVKINNVASNIISLDKLNAGDSISITLKGVVKDNASMFFNAACEVKLEAQYDDLTKYPSQNLVSLTVDSDTDKINVPGTPSGTVSMETKSTSYNPGDSVDYGVTIKNTGTCDLKSILLKCTFDNKLAKMVESNTFSQAKSVTSTNGKSVSITKKSSNLIQVNSLEVGDSVTIPFVAVLKKDSGAQFRLFTKITMLPYYSTGDGTIASIDSSSAETEINVIGEGKASVAILANKTKGKKLNEKTGRYDGTATEGKYQTGDEVDYTVTVTNTGTSNLYNVKLEDILSDKLKEIVDEDASFVIPETGEVTTKNGTVVTIGTAEVTYNENYKAKYENDSILAQEENSSSSTTEAKKETTEASEATTASTTLSGALIVNAAETTTEQTITTDSDLLNKAFDGSGTTTNIDGDNDSTSDATAADDTETSSNISTVNTEEPFSIQLVSSGTDSGESGQTITLAQLPANDSVQLHFKVKLNSKATNANGLENTVKLTASKLSDKVALEALKSDKTMEDSDKISVESAASLRIAKLADKTKGVTLKDGRYEGTKVIAKYGPDSTVKYKIIVTNLGSNTATNLLVTEEPSEQLKELSKWGKFNVADSIKTKNGKAVKVTVDGVTAVIDKLASKDSVELEFDVKLKKDITDASSINNSVSISGNYVVNGQEVTMTATDFMSDSDSISIDKTVKASGNEKKKSSSNSNSSKNKTNSSTSKNGKVLKSSGTKTGDNSPITLLLSVMFICILTIVILFVYKKNKR